MRAVRELVPARPLRAETVGRRPTLAEAEAPRTAGSVPGVGEKARVPPAPSASAITACFIVAVPCAQTSRLVALAHPLERDGGKREASQKELVLRCTFFFIKARLQ